MAEVSSTRLYLGNLPRDATKNDIEEHFSAHGTGKITEIKLMNGFGFVEYDDAMDARDIVPAFHGSDFKGSRLTVQFARGPRHKENFSGPQDRNANPRPRRTVYRMTITGLQPDTSWQDLKDFARQSKLDVVYSETGRERDGKGFVEFETLADLNTAVEKLDGVDFKGSVVQCKADVQEERPDSNRQYRQRSPMARGRYDDGFERRGPPPRGFSPRGYRDRSPGRGPPPPRAYEDRYADYPRRSPPPYGAPPPRRDYPPIDPYDTRSAPPPRGYPPPEAYPRDYARPRSPPRASGYGYGGYQDGYDRRYW